MIKKSKKSINSHSSLLPKALLFLLLAIIVFCFAAIFIYSYAHRNTDAKLKNDIAKTAQQTIPSGKQPADPAPAGDKGGEATPSSSAAVSPTYTISIIKAYQQEDYSLVVQTKIIGTGNGTCSLKVSQGNQIVTKEADVLFQPAYSTCTGFTVPYSELGMTGNWDVRLDLKASNGTVIATADQIVVIKR